MVQSQLNSSQGTQISLTLRSELCMVCCSAGKTPVGILICLCNWPNKDPSLTFANIDMLRGHCIWPEHFPWNLNQSIDGDADPIQEPPHNS